MTNFLWGAATSAHQVEGGNTNNDWFAAELSGRVPAAGLACDSYHRYEEDFDLAVALGHTAHRLSLEWSRLEPREGEWDMKEVAHYRQVLQALKDRHLKSFVTLWHFTLPIWVSSPLAASASTPVGSLLAASASTPNEALRCLRRQPLRGWEDPKTSDYFARYASFCAQQFGDLVDFWITLNEPQVYVHQGFLDGRWPPFYHHDIGGAFRAFGNLMMSHNKAYKAIKEVLPESRVGVVENFGWTNALVNFFNHNLSLFLIKNQLDFIGVNYYFYHRVHFSLRKGLQYGDKIDDKLWVSDLGWTLYPRAIYEVLRSLSHFKKPIYITENGLADASDVSRQKFIEETIEWVKKAMDEGVDVRGYLHWSLLDNYEWAEGYKACFGLVAVDFDHGQKRTIRSSALWLRDFIASTTACGFGENVVK